MADDAERVWIGLGGNTGSVRAALTAARLGLRALSACPLVISPLVETPAWGPVAQPPFINQVVGLMPRGGPASMLARLQRIEALHGRTREERWGPRTLDLDLLCWPRTVRSAPDPVLPHPRLQTRRFVLAPWAAVAPELVVPGLGRTVGALLADCSDSASLRWLA